MKFYCIFLIFFIFQSCTSTSMKFIAVERRINVGPGPEDMVLDRSIEEPRLLISCASRREGETPFGEIIAYYPQTGLADTLVRYGMPDNLYFQPHGIFLDSISSPSLLYAISHEREEGFHPVYIFEVGRDSLLFKELISSELVYSPNALTLGPEGEIFIVNDAGKRGNMMEKAFKLNRANIVMLKRKDNENWKATVVAEGLGYPAGINRIGNTIYAGDAVNHKIHLYTFENGGLIKQDPIMGLKGNDNIRVVDGMIYVTGHVKPFKFISHVKSSANPSPVEVWRIDPLTHEVTSVYYTEGKEISAGSTAIMLNGQLFISQVFDPFILEVTF